MRPYWNPTTNQNYTALQCYNCQMDCTCEWEYANNNEIDDSPDNGAWTSLDTNNKNGNDDLVAVEEDREESVVTSVAPSEDSNEEVNEKCSKCHFSQSKAATVCFNGSSWIKKSACKK